jgi:predicted nucleic acid-binding protein
MTLVDTNVLLDVATNDRDWAEWSVSRLDAAAIRGPLLINAVVYAEFSVGLCARRGRRPRSRRRGI